MSQSCSKPKGQPEQMEDLLVETPHYVAVFDGATPKTAFRFPLERTPGQVAVKALAEALCTLAPTATAAEAVQDLSQAVHLELHGHTGEASGVIYSRKRREIWSIGDCQWAFLHDDGLFEVFHPQKRIDLMLSQWRASIIRSYISRNIMTQEEILSHDPGRRIIQHFITSQVRYQNQPSNATPLAFGVFSGEHIPTEHIRILPIPDTVSTLILASDGFPKLFPTLEQTESYLQKLLLQDPLCIGALQGTKATLPNNTAPDDRTYIKLAIPSSIPH